MNTETETTPESPEAPKNPFDPSRVHVARIADPEARRAWFQAALKALCKVKSREVIVVKPDLSAAADGASGVTTSLWMIEDTIRWIIRKRGRPVLLVSPEAGHEWRNVLEVTGLQALCEETKTEIVHPTDGMMALRPLKHDDASGQVYDVQIASLAADGIVLLPKMKTSREDQVQLGIWNLLGVLSRPELRRIRQRGVTGDLLELYRRYEERIRASFVDGTTALEGDGPISGTPVEMNAILAGQSAIAVDGVATMMMGIDPEDVRHLVTARDRGLAKWDEMWTLHPCEIPLPVRPFTPAPQHGQFFRRMRSNRALAALRRLIPGS